MRLLRRLLVALDRWLIGTPPASADRPSQPAEPTSDYQRGFLRGYHEGRADAHFGN